MLHQLAEHELSNWYNASLPIGITNRTVPYNHPMSSLKIHFLLDPNVVFLNHGSYGATPRPVFEAYHKWQLRLEHQPVLFLGREFNQLMYEARSALGEYLNAEADDLVFIPNATHGVNIIAHSLHLQPGDEILTTDHEYGACDYTWDFICSKAGARYIHQHIPLPVHSREEVIEQFWQGVTPQTKVIYLSHITSSTALRLPVAEICRRARQAGLLTVVDAAHSPGQIPVDLSALDADVVTGNCHKWMLAPKGSAFLYVRREIQPLIEPLVLSWGFHPTPEFTSGSRFIDLLQWTGTRDPSPALTTPSAIQFMREQDWGNIRLNSHRLLRQAIERVCDLTNLPPLYPLDSDFYSQMGIAPLPLCDPAWLKSRLYDEYRIEIPVIQWQNRQFLRISIQGYNDQEDVDALLKALASLFT